MSYRLGIDVGGTFTDFILVGPGDEVALSKVPTTLADQSLGVMQGIAGLAAERDLELRALLEQTDAIVHGTTTADNTLIEMNGAVTGLLTTEGHRDEIDIRRGFKEEIWDPAYPPPEPIAPRRRRLGLPERLDFRGQVLRPLDEEATRRAARRLRQQGVESVAICLLFSFVNPRHEQRVAEIVAEECPEARISLSHEVMPAAPEFERSSTTLVDAYVGPRVEGYLERLQAALAEAGYGRDLLVMQSNGGITSADVLLRRPVAALGSGPTGGVIGACEAARHAETPDFIAIDMGGTSYEVCLVRGGQPDVRSFWNWQHRYLVGLPMIEMHSIGAGGGSIASVEAGALRVGPESAKAEPGPICYGRGGSRVTVTDANLLLGYLNPEALCGGQFKLRSEGLREAMLEQIGRPLGLDATQAAHGVFRIVNANMANAIRRVSSHAGRDPRAFAMVVYGGNGPLHAGRQAEELGIRRLVVPKTSPAFSALGLLVADHAIDLQRSYIAPSGRAREARVNELLDELESAAGVELADAGVAREQVHFERSLNLCYPGQTFDLTVPAVLSGTRMAEGDLARTVEAFHDLHEERHTYAVREEEPVLRGVRLHASGRTPKPPASRWPEASGSLDDALGGRRDAYFDGAFVDTPVYDGERLGAGQRIDGPAIVEERFTTLVIYPGQRAELDARGHYVVELD